MLGRLLTMFRRKGVLVPDVSGLAEGEARKVDIGDPHAGGRRVILCRVDGALHALDARCPHGEGGEIATGPLEDGRHAVCPLHRYKFDPASGKPVGVACRPAKRFRVEARGAGAEIFV